jgi:predicted membrane channel-forming protein YqfA (hemolysin III family)
MSDKRIVGAGGTPGGVGQFFLGILLVGIGAYLVLNQVQVTSSWGHFWGFNSFGLSLVPLLTGIGILFYNGKSTLGWILTILGLGIILAGILMNMDIYFKPTSLYNTLFMLAMLAGGIGLIARSLRPGKDQDITGGE